MMKHAHEQDLGIQDKYGVKFITYWYDEKRGTAFCLVDSPDIQSIKNAHNASHGQIPHEIIEVDPMIVESFLGRMKDPEPEAETNKVVLDSAFKSIMFTDLKDSTLMTSTHGDKKALHLLHVHNSITRNALRARKGREVKHTGDGIMASFDEAINSVECAIEIQREFSQYNASNPSEKLFLRIGISAGEPIEENDDLFGTVVQLAARLCNHAQPGQIVVSDVICDECNPSAFPFNPIGEIELKGFTRAIEAFEVGH